MTSTALKHIKKVISDSPQFEKLLNSYRSEKNLTIKNAYGSLSAITISLLYEKESSPLLFILPYADQAEAMKAELSELMGNKNVRYFPPTKILPWGHRDTLSVSQQLEVIEELLEFRQSSQKSKALSPVIVTTGKAVSSDLQNPEYFLSRRLDLKSGEELPFEDLIEQLIEMGFERQPIVEEPGELSVRGGIIDVFPFSRIMPLRIEFWGDQIESIREFDPTTQRSENQISKVIILPQEISFNLKNRNGKDQADKNNDASTLLEFLPKETVVCFYKPERIAASIENEDDFEEKEDSDWLTSDGSSKVDDSWKRFYGKFDSFRRLVFTQFQQKRTEDIIDLGGVPQQSFNGDLKLLTNEIEAFVKQYSSSTKTSLNFVCESDKHAERIAELFEERELSRFNINVFSATISSGFKIPELGLVVYTDHEFYGRTRQIRKRRKYRNGLTFRQLKRLSQGDYVVHVDHGIGIFQGLEKIAVDGHERECLVIHYLDNDKIFVPLDKMDRVQKYTAREAVAPKIHKLGSLDWERLKKRTKKQIKDIARDLIKLYASRKAQKGFEFSKDTHWQRELEASFPYEDTPDQAKAVDEVKADMETDQPMDRLVCGDVGYGKTEVAIRAAFKTVQDSKQVAVLAPTTLLVQQHYNTFKERLGRYPVSVEVLSRFRTKAEQTRVLERLKSGEVDVVIGTHRLLSKDVGFKNLGLLVVDEEQRFGVRHKERLKSLKVNVDVLTLSATPIPRTLHMSLVGVRDMSTINTPPRDRLPIQTEVAQYDRDLVRQAILKEVHRGGQVFFVHNRVHSIYRIAGLLEKLVPEVEIGVAHGQMKEKELENKMIDFMNKKFHVLVATMIIESGLDIPNVNTMIINRADRFGLAQLYQLRGRVGRSHHKAYCYLLVPPIRNLSVEAIKRLETIEEFTELGSGFQIALRDLEIRGAGNLLGAQQSGMIDAIGFDLYTKTLDEAVRELKLESQPERELEKIQKVDCRVEIDGDAFLPEDYVDLPEERIAIYRRLAEADNISEIEMIQDELKDRFGRLPEPAINLFGLMSLRLLGSKLGISRVKVLSKESRSIFSDQVRPSAGQSFKEWVGSLIQRAPFQIEFFQNSGLGFKLQAQNGEPVLLSTVKLLETLSEDS